MAHHVHARRAPGWRAWTTICAMLGFAVALFAQPAGATGGLTVTKTAGGYAEREVVYDWTIDKTVSPGALELAAGQDGQAAYRIDAVRTTASDTTVYGVRGEICVRNDSTVVAPDVMVTDEIRARLGGGVVEIVGTTTLPVGTLAVGESACVSYELPFTPISGATYQNHVRAAASNSISGNDTVPFTLPAPTVVEIDEAADVADAATCPAGYTCTPSATGPWHLTATGSIEYTTTVTNVSAACGSNRSLVNTATLTESDTGQRRTDGATVSITSVCATDPGCTRTIGYWKTHDGTHGRNADEITQYLPIWLGTPSGAASVRVTTVSQATTILKKSGDASNGVNKLQAQLLGAKLNVAAGASSSAVTSELAQADAYLATHAASGWASFSAADKQQAIDLASLFDRYNNGLTGPGHCD